MPREVLRLARGQERQLRTWLYSPDGYGREPKSGESTGVPTPPTLSAAIAAASGEVEDTFAIVVAPVFVGDCPMDEKLAALAQAAREAMVNAAKHSGQSEVSVYVEVEPAEATVFVRDRGKGFDPASVPEDRHGVADSIHGRMARYGGTVRLRTAPGEGTEVHLTMPRTAVQAGTGPVSRDRAAKPARPTGRLRDRIGRKGTRKTSTGDTGGSVDQTTVKEPR